MSPELGSGPHLVLAVAVVRLARRDLDDPRFSDEARAFLRVEPFDGRPVGFEADLVAELLGTTRRLED
jgi:hypothetical protein